MVCQICAAEHSAEVPCSTIVKDRSEPSGTQLLAPDAPLTPTPGDGDGPDPLLGITLGSFKIVRRIGIGGMGTVYLGEQTVIGSKVAVKILHPHLASNPSLVQRFYAEARAVNLIGHENIVNIFDMNVVPPNRYYLIMEYLEGKPLTSLTKGPLSAQVAIPVLSQVCDALLAAHGRGVIHRDLKPENIFLVKRGRSDRFVKILDFGIAKLFSSGATEETTSAGVIVGTPEFMAPEQCNGEAVDGRADLYAVGIISYLLATGSLPFSGGGLTGLLIAHREKIPVAPHRVNPRVSPAWSAVIMQALAKRPEDRFHDAAEMRDALEASLNTTHGRVVMPVQEPAPEPTSALTPEPVHSRHLASFEARVSSTAGAPLGRFRCSDISRGGLFLCAESAVPPIFSRVKVALEGPQGSLECLAEVVRHVTPEQAKAWNMLPGFGVQFWDLSPQTKEALARLVQGLPTAKPAELPKAVGDDAGAEPLLAHYRKRINGDHYVVLALTQDAEPSDVRARARAAQRELEALKERKLSPGQLAQVAAALGRVGQALDTIGDLHRRLEYDGNRGNYRGVARCLAAGITITELENSREGVLAKHPGATANAQIQFATGNAWEAKGQLPLALEAYEAALSFDPMNIRYHQRYWGLKRRAPPAKTG
ncbi:MAG: protein kinase domain-containing protein [Myxococcaceae bacterium]